jgi:uncharacterized membrane protein
VADDVGANPTRAPLGPRAPVTRNLGPLAQHWLALANAAVAVFVGLPFAAPALLAAGWTGPANTIYTLYRAVCHQWAFRSYFLFGPYATYSAEELQTLVGPSQIFGFTGSPDLGFKVAFCERDVAIYAALLLAGLAFALVRSRVSGLSLPTYLLAISPMAIDGFTQLFGWRESTVLLRTATGAMFGVASVWLIYPRIDRLARGTLRSMPRQPVRLGAAL